MRRLARGSHSTCSQMVVDSQSPAITQAPQVGFDGLLQFRGLGELGVQFSDEVRSPLLGFENVGVADDCRLCCGIGLERRVEG